MSSFFSQQRSTYESGAVAKLGLPELRDLETGHQLAAGTGFDSVEQFFVLQNAAPKHNERGIKYVDQRTKAPADIGHPTVNDRGEGGIVHPRADLTPVCRVGSTACACPTKAEAEAIFS